MECFLIGICHAQMTASKVEKIMDNIKKIIKRERRFLLLMPEYVWGGAETQFRYLINYAEKHKWKLDVIVEHRFKKYDAILEQDIKKMTSVVIYKLNWYNKLTDAEILRDMIVWLLTKRCNVKYTICLIHYTADLILAPVLRFLGIDVIYSERSDASWISKNIQYERNLKYCNKILANSKYAQSKLADITGRKVSLIRNGKFIPAQLPIKESRIIRRIFVPGRIAAYKNQILLLHYIKENPRDDIKLIFAGVVEDKTYKRKMDSFIKANDLQDKVEFLGYIENMEEEYDKADLVALPSLVEGTPNVVLEAYAYGRPVIVSDIEMERDVVGNAKLRFSVKNVEDIHACIRYIEGLSDEEYKKLLRDNREFVIKNYNIERMAEQFYTILSKKK